MKQPPRKVLFATTTTASRRCAVEDDESEDSRVDDATFLAGLETNARATPQQQRQRSAAAAAESLAVCEQIGTAAAFVGVFASVSRGALGPWALVAIDAALLALFFSSSKKTATATSSQQQQQQNNKRRESAGGAIAKLVFVVAGVSPVLRALFGSVSTDSAHRLSALLLLGHVFGRGFGAPFAVPSAVFASVLLASRLPSALHAFGIVVYAVLLFALFPHHQQHQQQRSLLHCCSSSSSSSWWWKRKVALNGSLLCVNALLLWPLSHAAFAALVLVLGFVSGVCPLLLVSVQKTKREINGPWDEAVPVIPPATPPPPRCFSS